MEWRTLTKAEAAKITGQWIQMPYGEFQDIVDSWPETVPSGLDNDYRQLRVEVINAWNMVKNRVSASEEYRKKQDYYSDLFFAKELYTVLKSRNFSIRMASNDQVWIYMCVIVFPDLVHSRYPGSVKKNSDGTTEKVNVNEERFWRTRRRIYLKVLWWYIYLSIQIDENGKEDLDGTVDILKDNSTDEIVQIVERSGIAGYRVDLYRAMMKYYSLHRDVYDNKKFRQVMVLNTARSQIIEPSLMDGGVQTYVKELFEYFG